MNFHEIITELNTDLLEKHNQDDHRFNYTTDGFNEVIKFDSVVLWDSRIDERHGKYKEFILYLKRKYNEYADTLWKLKW